jgi:rfaE bifunctional protein kinase chain/domain
MPNRDKTRVISSESTISEHTSKIVSEIRAAVGKGQRIVFVSGNFNVLHPGHLRLLKFAADCGEYMVVGVTKDGSPGTLIPENLRHESIKAISLVDYSFIMKTAPEEFIAALRPHVVVKGKEHEQKFNPEHPLIENYGGKLLFGSGEVRFSSIELLQRELHEVNLSSIRKPGDYCKRHEFSFTKLASYVKKYSKLKVVVIGDLIVDEHINCDPLGMSQEDPTIVVTPINCNRFVGGAGIVAAHARGLGAEVTYFGVVGNDEAAAFSRKTLEEYGVAAHLIEDDSRPTTLKQRYRARSKTLLRVSHLRQHAISHELVNRLFASLAPAIDEADLLIFSDFNYGCLPQSLVESVNDYCTRHNVMMAADSQASSQVCDVTRFKGMHLITPTEHEARLSYRDATSGLIVLADNLQRNAKAKYVFITLGAEGLLIHAPCSLQNGLITDQLPSFNAAPKDVSGAGDSLLTCAAMSLAVGATIWESGYLGSIAAACQTGRVGNLPLTANEIIKELSL